MKILIDGHMLGTNEGGNERYTENLANSLMDEKGVEVKILAREKYVRALAKNKQQFFITLNSDSDWYRLIAKIPFICAKNKINLVHSNYIAPFFKNSKQVVTVHDFCFKRYPHFFSLKEKLLFATLLPLSLSQADVVIVPSEFSKKEALKFYPNLRGKISVTPEAVDDNFYPCNKKQAESKLYEKYGINRPFLLCLNSKNPKKNINRVIKAFNNLQQINYPDLKLVIVGGRSNIKEDQLKNKQIIVLSYVPDIDLNLLYNVCEIFIYYSLYEGFGLPIIEALKCEAPVIASDIEVHREISQGAVLYADPLDHCDLVKKIKALLSNRELRRKIAKRGKKVADSYSWSKTARATIRAYQLALATK